MLAPASDPIVRDLGNHFRSQVGRLIIDALDTSDRVDMHANDRIGLIVSALANLLVAVAYKSDGDERDLHELIRLYYQHARDGGKANG